MGIYTLRENGNAAQQKQNNNNNKTEIFLSGNSQLMI